jgi:hypothetical protein
MYCDCNVNTFTAEGQQHVVGSHSPVFTVQLPVSGCGVELAGGTSVQSNDWAFGTSFL